jgi:hypothetical protein
LSPDADALFDALWEAGRLLDIVFPLPGL